VKAILGRGGSFHLGILEVPQVHEGVLNFGNDCGGAEGGRAYRTTKPPSETGTPRGRDEEGGEASGGMMRRDLLRLSSRSHIIEFLNRTVH
jgi:hypothetical protein